MLIRMEAIVIRLEAIASMLKAVLGSPNPSVPALPRHGSVHSRRAQCLVPPSQTQNCSVHDTVSGPKGLSRFATESSPYVPLVPSILIPKGLSGLHSPPCLRNLPSLLIRCHFLATFDLIKAAKDKKSPKARLPYLTLKLRSKTKPSELQNKLFKLFVLDFPANAASLLDSMVGPHSSHPFGISGHDELDQVSRDQVRGALFHPLPATVDLPSTSSG